MKDKLVVIALSGGVDSTVAGILLKQQGYKLHGVYMQNWDPEINGEDTIHEGKGCSQQEELKLVKKIAKQLDIPLSVYNFVPEYWENVFQPFLEMIKNKWISNPDVLCNSKIKFGVLLDQIKKDISPDIKLATGHYARVINKDNKFYLGTCKNLQKDQTYFLSGLNSSQLSNIIFPLSDFVSKQEVRKVAQDHNFDNWNKTDSRGICFIGKRNFNLFLNNYLKFKSGDIVDIESKKVVGQHNGLNFYVLHQRNGLNISGQIEKYYVCDKDYGQNILYVCLKSQIPKYLYFEKSVLTNLFWINEIPNAGDVILIKSKHGNQFIQVTVQKIDKDEMVIEHNRRFITSPGQYVVFYSLDKKICLGSSVYKTWKK